MRICSFFPSATELLYALGCGRAVVARSQRCDYPPSARRKPIVVRSRIASAKLSSRGIHKAVESLRSLGEHQYLIDVPLLKRLRPDLVVTQELCNVCAAGHPEVMEAIQQLPRPPRTVTVSARRFEELFSSIDVLGRAVGRARLARLFADKLRRETEMIQKRIHRAKSKPKVWCAEWLDPLLAAGHWIPEMVSMAGGRDLLGVVGEDSARMTWGDVQRINPDVIIVMPCSFSLSRTKKEFPLLTQRPGWKRLSAVKGGRVFAVETGFFHRPGPRLVKGLKLMASLFHPDLFPQPARNCAQALLS